MFSAACPYLQLQSEGAETPLRLLCCFQRSLFRGFFVDLFCSCFHVFPGCDRECTRFVFRCHLLHKIHFKWSLPSGFSSLSSQQLCLSYESTNPSTCSPVCSFCPVLWGEVAADTGSVWCWICSHLNWFWMSGGSVSHTGIKLQLRLICVVC